MVVALLSCAHVCPPYEGQGSGQVCFANISLNPCDEFNIFHVLFHIVNTWSGLKTGFG